MFLDDGLGGKSSCESTKVDAIAVKIDLCALGFVLSSRNCNWHPSLIQTWLGYVLNIFENKLYVTVQDYEIKRVPFNQLGQTC